ncbi:MAG: nucleotidyltransferase family protein [Lachnospiraceae bacterium]|nr:nucleotidyltransferase family protein [Lachnospiraceae bacterium]
MKVAGVIAEFDPFHNGHAFFLRRVRELTSADFIIAVMSGDFTQRGNIAIAGKRLRAETALRNGADMVIELPVRYATASAEQFACGGVSLLGSLGCVDTICFGTEEEDITLLKRTADVLNNESVEFKEQLNANLKSGMNYPTARMEAIVKLISRDDRGLLVSPDIIKDIMSRPNNILALEYMKAICRTGSSMKAVNVKREATDHDSLNTYGVYSSAKNIRQTLKMTQTLEGVAGYMPESAVRLMRESFDLCFPLFDDDMSLIMKYRLLLEDEESLMEYSDMNADLARRIVNKRNEFISVSQFTELIKTRNLTYTRISRALLHTLLSITKKGAEDGIGYARVLGFRKEASPLMDKMQEESQVPVITRTAEYKKVLKSPFIKMLEEDLRASDIYHAIIKDIYDTEVTPDISSMVVTKDDIIMA